jgi:hypothetical protein
MSTFVQFKLLCGPSVDRNTQNHAFALLAPQLCLDPCTNSEAASELIRDSIDNHLRLAIGYDQSNGLRKTITPSEPIVVDAAASVLMEAQQGGLLNMVTCINTFATALLRGELVERGGQGRNLL